MAATDSSQSQTIPSHSKTAWIIGASSGIGSVLARKLAMDGHRVAVSARSAQPLQELAADSANMAGEIIAIPLDATSFEQFQQAAKQAEEILGPIDTVLHNAAIYCPMPLSRFSASEANRIFSVNIETVTNGLDVCLNTLKKKPRQIIITTSPSGYRGMPGGGAYGASKAALITLAEGFHAEMKAIGIDLRIINPGFVDTPLTSSNRFHMPFLMSAEEAAGRILKKFWKGPFEIYFPKRMILPLKIMRILPTGLLLRLSKKLTPPDGK
ncbi:SDR family NAD(P)-dependent oxidoreductase [Parendozoicomonas haliclonae]|uniref:Putative oxidoreductase n=1 Tax=Parendozoicomonas haliclonae TaxID=1960125 RepID=A0A1X7AJ37_9GAMM|nr:SDR family NAD(P)-dependent oxidoreductase [Parendozoicomonas haliclonae]SMA45948.1 putative oxidoreductase [Parendozoicomonas haliclonae]